MYTVGCVPCVHTIGIHDAVTSIQSDVVKICRIFVSPSRALPPVGEWSCPPPAPGKLRGLNALSGLPHGIASHMRDLDLVSDPEYQTGQESAAPWSGAHTIFRCPCGFQNAVREPCGTQNFIRGPTRDAVIPDPTRLEESLAAQRTFAMNVNW